MEVYKTSWWGKSRTKGRSGASQDRVAGEGSGPSSTMIRPKDLAEKS